MADAKVVRDEAPPRELHPADEPYPARCVDVIDLGLNPESWQGGEPELKDKIVLVYRTAATYSEGKNKGQHFELSREFNCSFGKKSNLRKWVEAWRNKPYSDEEARKQGVPLDKFEGVPALLTITHETSGTGNVYAKLAGISKLPAAMAGLAPSAEGYKRAEFWEKKKAEYAEATAKFSATHKTAEEILNADMPEIDMEAGDDLPFDGGVEAMYARLDADEREDGMPGSPTWVLERE